MRASVSRDAGEPTEQGSQIVVAVLAALALLACGPVGPRTYAEAVREWRVGTDVIECRFDDGKVIGLCDQAETTALLPGEP